MTEITLAIAVLAGLGSFVAPCILPMIPAFLAYLSGTTLTEIARVISAMNKSNNLTYKAFFQIYSTSYSVAFYSSIKYSST